MQDHSARAPPRWSLRAEDSWDISHLPQHFVVPLWGPISVPILVCSAHPQPEEQGKAQSNAQSSDTGAGMDVLGH